MSGGRGWILRSQEASRYTYSGGDLTYGSQRKRPLQRAESAVSAWTRLIGCGKATSKRPEAVHADVTQSRSITISAIPIKGAVLRSSDLSPRCFRFIGSRESRELNGYLMIIRVYSRKRLSLRFDHNAVDMIERMQSFFRKEDFSHTFSHEIP